MRKRTTNGIPAAIASLDLVLREPLAASIVLERLAARPGGRALLLQLRGRAEASVCPIRVQQALHVGLMALEVRALMHDLLVPIESEPLEALENGAGALLGAARLVGVLDAQQELCRRICWRRAS